MPENPAGPPSITFLSKYLFCCILLLLSASCGCTVKQNWTALIRHLLVHDALSVNRLLYSVDDRATVEWWWIRNGLVWSDRCPVFTYYTGIRLQGLRKTTKSLNQDSRLPGRDVNPGPPEHESGVLTCRPLCSGQFWVPPWSLSNP
jgi:hypothetical protein